MCFAAVTLPKIAVTIVVIRNVKCSRVCATHLYYSILNQSVIIIKNILEGGAFNDQGFCLIAFWSCCIFPLDVLTKAILEGSSAHVQKFKLIATLRRFTNIRESAGGAGDGGQWRAMAGLCG